LRLFDHKGDYVRTIYPFPADRLKDVKGLEYVKFPHGEEQFPLKRFAHRTTLLTSGDRATLWIHDETGLPARVELHSVVWGEATFTTRSISTTAPQPPALFTFLRTSASPDYRRH
jgi:hypothetical protein